MRPFDVILDVLTVSRLTRLVVDDEITRPIREKIDETWPDSKVAYLVSCPACTSVWTGVVVQVLPRPVRYALALSQITLVSKWAQDAIEATIRRAAVK